MRIWYKGIMCGFQPLDMGSIPIIRFRVRTLRFNRQIDREGDLNDFRNLHEDRRKK